MITVEELGRVKGLRKTSLYYAEKEYLQYIFLNALTRHEHTMVFKGGTCLRICYGLERASEDLDFVSGMALGSVRTLVNRCLKDFDLLNINHRLLAEKEFKGNVRFELRFEGPLYSGRGASTNMLKIDVNRGKVHLEAVKVVPQLFSDVPMFTMVVMDEREILAEKIRALVNRSEPRDLYDVWVLYSKGLRLEPGFLRMKLREEKSDLAQLKYPSEREYVLGLKNLVRILPPYGQVVRETERWLRG